MKKSNNPKRKTMLVDKPLEGLRLENYNLMVQIQKLLYHDPRIASKVRAFKTLKNKS